MKYEFSIDNIDCANCASKIETALSKDEKFKHVSLNFMLKKLEVETKVDEEKNILQAYIQKEASRYEDSVTVTEYVANGNVRAMHSSCECGGHDHNDDHHHNDDHGHDHAHDHSHNHESSHINGHTKAHKINSDVIRIAIALILLMGGVVTKQPIVYVLAYAIVGYDVLLKAAKNITKGKVFDENFLMGIATVAAFAIKEYPEAVAVMIFYQIGEYLQHRAVSYSRKAISELIDIRPEFARIVGNEIKEVDPSSVKIGDIIEVRPGEKVPLDGILIEGSTFLDTSALTGESLPVAVSEGETILSGSINKDHMVRIRVTTIFKDSTVSKILNLIESASSKKSVAENFITKFAAWYTPIVVILAVMVAVIPSIITGDWHNWIYTSVVFLVISCPCALVVSIPLGFFGGIGAASKKGILIKGSNYLEKLNEIDTVVLDKTGTITKGKFGVQSIITNVDVTREELLRYAAIAEASSNHPIAKSIMEYCKDEVDNSITSYNEIAGYGVQVECVGETILAGNTKLMNDANIVYEAVDAVGTCVYIAVNEMYKGCIVVADQIKDDSKVAIANLKKHGIKKVVMLTGDKKNVAEDIAKAVGVDEFYSELLPQDKVWKLESILAKGNKVAFVGDGINDAPVLARADVGIAMGGIGSDAAVEASDIVIMTDALSLIVEGKQIANKTRQIVTQNIVFALGIKVIIMILGIMGITTMWLAVFADVGVSLLAILNSLRVLKN
ncbi:MAG: heavy metal translocating P-type ATPase [Cellulosilyticaceae bacterium]